MIQTDKQRYKHNYYGFRSVYQELRKKTMHTQSYRFINTVASPGLNQFKPMRQCERWIKYWLTSVCQDDLSLCLGLIFLYVLSSEIARRIMSAAELRSLMNILQYRQDKSGQIYRINICAHFIYEHNT